MTLRDAIKQGLRDQWTQELEDRLFWPLAEFIEKVRGNQISSLSGSPKDWPEPTKEIVREALKHIGRILA